MKDEHVHTPDDGRGLRDVWVNGQKIDGVFFADTKRGIVECYRDPMKPHKYGKRLLTKRIRGEVVVKLKC